MTGPEPKSAELIAADATTALPWQTVRDALADVRMYCLATTPQIRQGLVRPGAPNPAPPAARTSSSWRCRQNE